jgi:spore maturation protein CgeB
MTGLIAGLKKIPLAAAANARLKAWLVERDAVATRNQYLEEASRRGLVAPEGSELQAMLAYRIAGRKASLGWPKRLGDLHLFLAYPLCNWEAVLPKALSPFGEVSAFEWRSLGFDDSAPDWLDRRDLMNQALLQAFAAANRRRPVDVVVGYLSGTTVDPAILREMAAQGAVITNFCFDDKIHWPGEIRGGRYTSTAGIAHAVDLNLTYDPHGMGRYFVHGGLSAFHAEAADPDSYKPLDVPFEYDVSFIGACYGWRPKLVEGLRRSGIRVECFGRGWPNGSIANDNMNGIYARSRINLGCGGIGYSKNLLCLKGRDFEVPMSGALYLTQNNPELSMVFEVGREILTYDDVEDCADVIRAILKDEDRASGIRAAARARCLKDHTYTARWTAVFTALGALTPLSGGGNTLIALDRLRRVDAAHRESLAEKDSSK